MILINYAHPLSASQLEQVELLVGKKIERVIEIPSQIDEQRPLVPQVVALLDSADLTVLGWRSKDLLINPPSLNFAAMVLLSELYGRCGYFPPVLRMRPVTNSIPTRYEPAEILNM